MKWKLPSLELLRWLTVAVAIVLLIRMAGQTPSPEIPLDRLETAALEQFDLSEVQQADNRMIRRLYGLNPADYAGVSLYYPSTNMGAEELLLVKLSDESQKDAVLAAVETRLETQKNSFDGYGVEQTALLNEHALIETRGVYVLFVVCQNARAVRQAVLDVL